MNNKLTGALLGFVMGFFILHPVSMVFQGLIHPDASIRLWQLVEAFNVHHLPMAFFFGVLGALFGFMNISYSLCLSKERHRVRTLESLLPICSYCKKIRDDAGSGNGQGQWVRIDHYISAKTDTEFTHGICPECYRGILSELEGLDKDREPCVDRSHETVRA
jgi:hypothetical protein